MRRTSKQRRGELHEVSSGETVNRLVWLEEKEEWELNKRGLGQIMEVEKPERSLGWCGG